MGQPITILGSTAIWPTTGDTGYSAGALQTVQLLATAVKPIEGLYNTTTGQVGNIAIDNDGNFTFNGTPIAGIGTVTSVAVASPNDIAVSGSPITSNGTINIDLAPTGVSAGSYTTANITVDAKGRITSASNGSPTTGGTVTSVSANGLQGVTTNVTTPTTTPNIEIGLGDITPLSVSTVGNLTFSGSNQRITGNFTSNTPAVQTSVSNGNTIFDLMPNGTGINSVYRAFNASNRINSGYIETGITDTFGYIAAAKIGTGAFLPLRLYTNTSPRLTIAVNGDISMTNNLAVTGTVTASNLSGTNTGNQTITATGDATGVSTGSPATTLPLVLANTAVVPGSYTAANITVDSKGRITAASSGAGGVWGSITGDITSQTDLNDVFNMIGNVTIGTGVTTTTDTIGLIALNDTTVRLKPTIQAVFSSLIPSGLSNADRTFPQMDYSLGALTFPGDGIFVRFIGVDTTGAVVTSPASFKNSPNVLQYGYLLVKQVAGVKTFLDGAAGPRNVFTWPDFAGNNAAESEYFTPITNIIITPNAALTVQNTTGLIKGLNINWGTANVNERAVLSQNPTTFTTINPSTALAASLPPAGTAVQVTQYWNGSAMTTLSGANASTVQRFFVTINGGLFLQVGEAAYANFATAIDNISVAPFTDIIPPESFIEIVRFASRNGSTNLALNSDAVFQSGGGGGGGGGGSSAGTVTSVNLAGAQGVTAVGGPITSSGSITVGLGAITPTSVTTAGNVTATGTVTGSNLTGSSTGTNTGDQTITLTGGVTGSGTGSFATTVVTNANLTGDVTSVGNATTLSTVNANVGAFTNANITVDAKGRITAAASGTSATGTVTSVGIASTTLTSTGGPISTNGNITVDLPAQASAGSFTNANITVDGFGRVTAASNGAGGVAGSNTEIQFNNSGAFGASSNLTWNGSQISVAGNLNLVGTGRRILADMSNATQTNRFAFQSNTTNGSSNLLVLPNGTSTSSAVQILNNSDPTNSGLGLFSASGTRISIGSFANGSGTLVPMQVSAGTLIGLTVDISGNVVAGDTAQLATTATTRFLYINGMAGVPTGTPATPVGSGGSMTGKVPLTFDNTTGHIWAYAAGAWHDPTIIEQNIQTVNYTTVLTDAGKQIFHPVADTSPRTFTIASNASVPYKIGTRIEFINQQGAGDIILDSSDTLLWTNTGAGGPGLVPTNTRAVATKITTTDWQVSLNGLSSSGGTPAGSNTEIQFNNSGAFGASSNLTYNGSELGINSNVNIIGTGRRILGNFGSTTTADRPIFQSSTLNTDTRVYAMPNGTGTRADFGVNNNSADPNNAAVGLLSVSNTRVMVGAVITGAGTPLPFYMTTGTGAGFNGAIDINSNAFIGGALAVALSTTATNGFFCVNSAPGIPTGTPAGLIGSAGKTPITVDTTTGHIWSYAAGAWHDPTIIEQNSRSADYTTTLTDAGKHLLHPSADTTARTFTIASNASVPYKIGTTLMFVNQDAAGSITIAISTDTMRLAGAGTTGNRTLAANGIATALKITATEWIINGTGLT